MSKLIAWSCAVLVSILAMLFSAHAVAQAPTIANPGPATSGKLDILIPASGLPLVVFQDVGAVKALQCANALCTGVPTSTTTVASLTSARIRVAAAADGLPIIGMSIGFSGLRAIKCGNAACTTSTTTVIDASNLGSNPDHALIVPADGRPIFAYYDSSNADLKVARCADTSCTGLASVVVADAAGFVGRAPGIALAAGLPQIAYNAGDNSVKLMRCSTMDCSTGNSFSTLTADNPAALSIMEGRDGASLIAYMADVTTQDSLRLIKCVGTSCVTSSVSTIDSISTGNGLGAGVQMRAGADGMPVLSYFDRTLGTVKVARCTRPDCASATTTTLHAPLSTIPTNNTNTALAINANGVPVVAYAVSGGSSLTIHSCNTRSCL